MNSYYNSVVPAHVPLNTGQTDSFYGQEGKCVDVSYHSNTQNMCYENEGINSYGMPSAYPAFHQNYDKLDSGGGHSRIMNLSAKQMPTYGNNGYYYQNSGNFLNSCNVNTNVNLGNGSPPSGLGSQYAEDRHVQDRLGKPDYLKSEENCIPTPPPNNFSPHEHGFNHMNNNPAVHGMSPSDMIHNSMNTSPPMPQHCNGMMGNPYPWMRQLPGRYTLLLFYFQCCAFASMSLSLALFIKRI